MNVYLRWFGIVTWLGIGVNALFWVPALFFPETLSKAIDVQHPEYTIWLRNTGMLLILVAMWNAAGAHAPLRRPLFAWLVPVARMIAALFFLEVWLFNTNNSSDRPEAFLLFFVVDAGFALVKGGLLQLGFPPEYRLGAANVRQVLAGLFSFPMFRKFR